MSPTVAVVGGGYAGISVAAQLDDVADVVLVEPRDAFVHSVASLRSLADPAWIDRIFLPYEGLLPRGRVVHDRASRVDHRGTTLASGERIAADYTVLATGSGYPFPAKLAEHESTRAKDRLRAAHRELTASDRVLLLGAGAVGLELAGEIKAAWPQTAVIVVEPGPEILSGAFTAEFRTEVRRQLDALGIELLLDSSLAAEPATEPGTRAPFTAATRDGAQISADIWFRCYGATVNTDYLAEDLAAARGPGGRLAVTPDLRLVGQERVFAVGDAAAVDDSPTAANAHAHADTTAANIRAMIGGGRPSAHTPRPGGIALPLGPDAGASYRPDLGVLGADATADIKGRGMMLDAYRDLLNAVGTGAR
ncbi:NAD(P)/FAD-dependent oxidoreductase [Streptomonospora wellingtoniae]|uniref:FAD-dependent oxidoreductase n=1 Tax=Streptomonospora wellingtoniae TaxID=3075544 RepID=A0ABU2L0E6_9ACTN|nr:FAD-dependent oxidoreductase [Streptomonospora sp. DSM 45055]MDT0304992.1 FAD-dependent oxidoreductase [Streptomonospora sp. DSM 45055]